MKTPWPFTLIQRRKHHVRYRAAIATIVSIFVYERLPPSEQSRVESELARWFSKTTEIPYTVQRPKMTTGLCLLQGDCNVAPWHTHRHFYLAVGSCRAFTWRRLPAAGAAYYFQEFDVATDEAIAELASHSVTTGATQGMGARWLQQMKARTREAAQLPAPSAA